MAYQAGGTPYAQFLEQRRLADAQLTGALERKVKQKLRKKDVIAGSVQQDKNF